jgi:hypothetical protein
MGDGPPNALHVTPSSVATCKWLVVGGVGFVREAFEYACSGKASLGAPRRSRFLSHYRRVGRSACRSRQHFGRPALASS